MTHRERVLASLQGRKTDRVPVSMWRHFFSAETTAEGLAEAMLGYQRDFDWDFMKVNPRASYHVEDWGVKTRYNGDCAPLVFSVPVHRPEDWSRIGALEPERGVLGEHLGAIELISKRLKEQAPFVMTVFNPLSVASRMAPSDEVFLDHLRTSPQKVLPALEAITQTFIRFSNACIDRGASGIFFATTAWATTARLTRQEYVELARPHDLRLLQSLKDTEFNILHVCRDHNMLDCLSDYPVHAFNWDCWGEGNPSLAEGEKMVRGKTVIGGVPHGKRLAQTPPSEMADELAKLHERMSRSKWMLGPGCTYDPATPVENVRVVRNAVSTG